jgi:hypothetical protein
MLSILSATLHMKEGLMYLMVTLGLPSPKTMLTRCDELG